MSTIDVDILARGQALADDLRREGRGEDAEVLQTLLSVAGREVEPTPYLTTSQVAARIGVSRQTVVNWIKRGVIPGVRLGGRLVVPIKVLERFTPLEDLLNQLDEEHPPLSAEEAAAIVRSGREGWRWQGPEE